MFYFIIASVDHVFEIFCVCTLNFIKIQINKNVFFFCTLFMTHIHIRPFFFVLAGNESVRYNCKTV